MTRWLLTLGLFAFGTYILTPAAERGVVRAFGRLGWGERYFGAGGTYTAWRLIGLACLVGGMALLRFGGELF